MALPPIRDVLLSGVAQLRKPFGDHVGGTYELLRRAARLRRLACALLLVPLPAAAQAQKPAPDLAETSLETLMNLEVTSVSKRQEKLSQTAAAIFVITQEDIRRSGATSIPELLRMVPGLQVAHIDASKWAISSRGFNARHANKLLVLIDGRSLYSSAFAGVFWEVQDLVLEDIERIEVIRGPGAALWGANAVNGVINIISKRAKDTQGGLVSMGGGLQERGFGIVRYGGAAGRRAYYRIYAKAFDRGEFADATGNGAGDGWHMLRGGFRVDWARSERDSWSFQGDAYQGDLHQFRNLASLTPPFSQNVHTQLAIGGGNLLGRWTRSFSDRSEMSLQVYYDGYTHREIVNDVLVQTVDFDFQHRFGLGARHDIVWGTGYRRTRDSFDNTFQVSFIPASRTGIVYSAFVQDQITLVQDRLHFTAGVRFENTPFTGNHAQPSSRLLWTINEKLTIWASFASVERTPDRAHRGLRVTAAVLPGPGGTPAALTLLGASDTRDERVMAFEWGYRIQPTPRLSIDLATFYNKYNDLQTLDPGVPFFEPDPAPAHIIVPLYFGNHMRGKGYGGELSVSWKATNGWKLLASYTYLGLAFQPNPGSVNATPEVPVGNSPRHQVQVRSQWNLSRNIEFDQSVYFVSRLTSQPVQRYTRLDLRLGWRPSEAIEISVVGQNLFSPRHLEFASSEGEASTLDTRKGYVKLTWRF